MAKDDPTVLSNIACRESAEALIKLAADFPESRLIRFWETVRDMAAARLPAKPEPPAPRGLRPMSAAQAQLFAQELMPFGAHKGKRVECVPAHYLIWLVEEKVDRFSLFLMRYVNSDYFQAQLED